MAIIYDSKPFKERIENALSDDFKHQAIETAQDMFQGKRVNIVAGVPAWEEFRTQAAKIRDHVLDNLDYYLNQFATNAEKAGAKVYFAKDDKEAVDQAVEIFRSVHAKSCVKSKSMMTEEIGLNHALIDDGVTVYETDLAEMILQLNDWNPPSHIVVPALHRDRFIIKDLFGDAGYEGSEDPMELTHFARRYMRDKFLAADVGVTGCNYGIAETGTTTLVTNEGNGRMVTALPKTQVIFMGMERILPNFECLDAIMQLFVRASVGAKITSYFSLSTGPKKANEVDGPEEQHIIIIDNGRTNILKGEFRQMLRCIRCGACLNICPVYRHITGHGYGSIYPGPMGAVLTPLMVGFENAKYLPFASTLCGACTDHCPVKIPLHEMLLRQRQIIVEDLKLMSPIEGGIFRTAGMGLSSSLLYDAGTKVAAPVMKVLSSGDKIKNDREIPVLRDWTSSRDMELMKSRKFRDWFKKHQKEKGGR